MGTNQLFKRKQSRDSNSCDTQLHSIVASERSGSMHARYSWMLLLGGLVLDALLLSALLFAQKPAQTPVFEKDILPILKANCLMCHSGSGAQAGLDVSELSSLLKGGKSGKSIQPGSSEKSLLLEKVSSGTMPPGEKKLSKAEVELLRQWVDHGATVEIGRLSTTVNEKLESVTENDVLPIFPDPLRIVSRQATARRWPGSEDPGQPAQGGQVWTGSGPRQTG